MIIQDRLRFSEIGTTTSYILDLYLINDAVCFVTVAMMGKLIINRVVAF